MSDNDVYAQLIKPSGILRVLLTVIVLIMVAGFWHANDFLSWINGMFPFMLWVPPAALIWLLLILMMVCILQIPWIARSWIVSEKAEQARRIWLIILAAASAGVCAGFTNLYTKDTTAFFSISYWHWPAAVWGGLTAAIITEWFYWHKKGQKPAATEAKLLELQARIRPHFLFNTLNSAMALVRLDPDAAEAVLQNLSILFRAALESGDGSSATVQQEIDLAKSYLSIESVRLGNRMHVQWKVDDATLDAMIPALSLQPILENAVRHGIEPADTTGFIKVKIRRRLGKVALRVANTVPSPEEQARHPTAGHGMALANLRARLSLMHDFEGVLKTRALTDASGKHWFITSVEVPTS